MSDHTNDSPDDVLPVLTRRQAEDFHAALGQVLARHAVAYTWNGDDSYTVGDAILGLSNLAALLAGQPGDEWVWHIEHHVSAFIRLRDDPLPEFDVSMIYPRVRMARSDSTGDYPVRGVIDRLEIVLAVDHPQYVSELNSLESVVKFGSWDVLWAAAMENLRKLPGPNYEVVDDDDDDALPIHAFAFEDHFGPSRILILRELTFPHLSDASNGLLVAIPDRHTVLVVEVDDTALVACGQLAAVAQSLFESSPGAVSSAVYYLGSDDSISRVAYLTEDGSTHVKPTDELLAAMLSAD